MIDHEEDILARPARSWFQTAKQKKEVAAVARPGAKEKGAKGKGAKEKNPKEKGRDKRDRKGAAKVSGHSRPSVRMLVSVLPAGCVARRLVYLLLCRCHLPPTNESTVSAPRGPHESKILMCSPSIAQKPEDTAEEKRALAKGIREAKDREEALRAQGIPGGKAGKLAKAGTDAGAAEAKKKKAQKRPR